MRTATELYTLPTFEERFRYLALRGSVGEATFGFDRWMNQAFYRSTEWKQMRSFVIARDNGLDLGCEGYEIHDRIVIHHMNPMSVADLDDPDASLNPEVLITTTHRTHNAIHYGDYTLVAQPLIERRPGDTRLW